MKKNFTLFCASLCLLAFVACKKEGSNPTSGSDITGTYKLISLYVKTSTVAEEKSGSDVVKSVSTSEYTTQDNKGTIVIDAAKMSTKDLSYTINSTVHGTTYLNGVVIGDASAPYSTTFTNASTSAAYTRVNADSIYFPSGVVFMNGTAQASAPAGERIQVSGNMLYLTSTISQTAPSPGITAIVNATAKISLQKQ